MTTYVYYLLSVIGIGYLITQSELFKSFRVRITLLKELRKGRGFEWSTNKLDGVVNCIFCASFWIGLAVYPIMFEFTITGAVFSAFSCMGTLYVIHNVFSKK